MWILWYVLEGEQIPMEGVTETKCGTETEGKAIQRLPHLGIHPIYRHQTQTLLTVLTRYLLTGASYSCLLRGSARADRCLQATTGLNMGSPMEELEKGLKGLRLTIHRKNNNINQPELPGTKPPTKEYTWRDP